MLKKQLLKNKNVVITGASGGLGKQIATTFAKYGCNLYLTGYNEEKLLGVVGEISNSYKSVDVFYKKANLEEISSITSLLHGVRSKFDKVDVLVNCAGIFNPSPLSETSISDFNSCFDVNVRAPFILSQEFVKDMVKNKWGRIINIGSSSSYGGFANTSVYCSSKHALLGLSRSLHNEFKHHNVRTYCFSPGSIKTRMGKKVKGQLYETFIDPEEIAEYIAFVISFNNEMISEEIKLNRVNIQ